MEYFLQQLINGVTLGSIYGLIAIGYTMVYGIIGMINFAHGDIFMIGAFMALILFLLLTVLGGAVVAVGLLVFLGIVLLAMGGWGLRRKLVTRKPIPNTFLISASVALILFVAMFFVELPFMPVVLLLVLLLGMFFTAVWGWTLERLAYRPLRTSFRLAPLITAIGMSIVLQNFVQLAQDARVKPLPPVITGGYTLMQNEGFTVTIGNIQITIMLTTVALMAIFSYIIAKTSLGRAQRACEQDRLMASLVGVNVDRVISLTFVMGASLAAVAGLMYLLYYGVIDFFIGFVAGIKAFTAAVLGGIGSLPGAMLGGLIIGLIEVFWAGYFSTQYKDVAAFSILAIVLIFLPSGLLGKPEIEKV